MSKAAALDVINLTKRFGGIIAVNDITIHVEPHEIHGIIGPNGAGKTTMFNMTTGIIVPTEGDIKLNGDSLVGLMPHKIANMGVGRTFQNIRLFGELSAYNNLVTACQNRMNYSFLSGCLKTKKYRIQEEATKKTVKQILSSVGLWELRDQTANNLPYGQQRRLEIARALVTDPRLLLLDEPAAGMNEEESYRLTQFVKSIRDNYDVTIIIIDHHMDMIMEACDNITVFNFGTKLAEGKPKEIQGNPLVIEAYLGVDEC